MPLSIQYMHAQNLVAIPTIIPKQTMYAFQISLLPLPVYNEKMMILLSDVKSYKKKITEMKIEISSTSENHKSGSEITK